VLKIYQGERPERPPALQSPTLLSNRTWILITECWSQEQCSRPPMKEVVATVRELWHISKSPLAYIACPNGSFPYPGQGDIMLQVSSAHRLHCSPTSPAIVPQSILPSSFGRPQVPVFARIEPKYSPWPASLHALPTSRQVSNASATLMSPTNVESTSVATLRHMLLHGNLPPDLPLKTPVCIGQLQVTALVLAQISYLDLSHYSGLDAEWATVHTEHTHDDQRPPVYQETIHIKSPDRRNHMGEITAGESFGVVEQKVATALGPMLGKDLVRIKARIRRGCLSVGLIHNYRCVSSLTQSTAADAPAYSSRVHAQGQHPHCRQISARARPPA
jgi:hypothetical protein